ncbi:polysaccharide deacetylase family protein [Bacillus rugosus]|uniref:polysaccharide deacetylase family protein n=1 Tax=Bacillus rugosus TaxID=2715209 RepID=UPI0035A27ED3
MYKKFVPFAVFLFLFFVSFEMMKNPHALDYIGAMKKDTVTVTASKDPLYEELLQKAPEYEVKPQDARIDKVWKSIPGYNGLKVNIEQSYKKMKKHGEFRENDLVYSQVKPKVHLKSLQPEPIYKGNPDKPMVALLINVAWGNEYLEKMLPILQKHQVKATFFLEGNWVRNNEQLAKKIAEDGHEIGNHSYNHPDMSKLTTGRISEQLDKTNGQIEQTIGVKPKWFAPPSGSFRKAVIDIAAEKQMGTVMWTVDTIDWQKPAPSVLQTRVLSKIHNGAMILMHPTDPTAESLEALITKIKDKGYALGTVTELMDETRLLK